MPDLRRAQPSAKGNERQLSQSGDYAHRESARVSVKVKTRYGDFTPIDSLALGYEISLKHAKCPAFSPP